MINERNGAKPSRESNYLSTFLIAAAFLSLASTGQAQLIMSQIADGADWRTSIMLTNTTASPSTATVTCYQDTSNGATTPWTPPFLETSNTQSLPMPAGGTYFLHTPGTATPLSQGWCQVTGTGISAYAIYTYESYNGRPDQDGTSEAVAAAPRMLVPFDNTTGFISSMAIVNPTGTAETVSVNIELDDGTISTATLPSLPPNGQLAFVTAEQLPKTSGHRGLAEFYFSNGSGSMAIAPFRFNSTLALTSSPAYPQASPESIIGKQPPPPLPQFGTVSISASLLPSHWPELGIFGIDFVSLDGTTYAGGGIAGMGGPGSPEPTIYGYGASWSTISVSGNTYTFSGLDITSTFMEDTNGNQAQITSATLTVTLTPQVVSTSGTVVGTVNLVSTLGTVSGSFTGTYTATLP